MICLDVGHWGQHRFRARYPRLGTFHRLLLPLNIRHLAPGILHQGAREPPSENRDPSSETREVPFVARELPSGDREPTFGNREPPSETREVPSANEYPSSANQYPASDNGYPASCSKYLVAAIVQEPAFELFTTNDYILSRLPQAPEQSPTPDEHPGPHNHQCPCRRFGNLHPENRVVCSR